MGNIGLPKIDVVFKSLAVSSIERSSKGIAVLIIKDDTEWSAYPAVKNGAQLMLMGTAEGKELKAPDK